MHKIILTKNITTYKVQFVDLQTFQTEMCERVTTV